MPVVELTKDNFEQVVTSNPTVVVDYWAPWCGPCRGFAPVFERVAEANPDPNYTVLDTVLPHPVYAAQRWICIVNPSEATFRGVVVPLLTLAHDRLAEQRARHGLDKA